MDWGSAKNFVALWAPVGAVAAFVFSSLRKKAQMRLFGELELVQRLVASMSVRKRMAKRILVVLALIFLVLALAQPRFSKKEIPFERRGVEVVIAVDVSNSMLAKDIVPNRLEKSKLELSTLIQKLKGDRIGIVAFAGEAVIQCPLTLDKGAAKLFLSTVNPNLVSYQGTAIGQAIGVALQAFTDKDKESKAIVLLTDGEDLEGNTAKMVQAAVDAGVRIFTIGIGTPEGSVLPEESGKEGYKKDRQGQVVFSRLNETLLKDIARQTGGVYYRSTRGELEVDALAREISQMKQKSLSGGRTFEYEENFQPFLLIAFILLAAEALLSERKRPGRS